MNNSLKIFFLFAFTAPIASVPKGYLVLQNRTPYDFELIQTSSIQMDVWEFPQTIKANSDAKIEIEFCENLFRWSWRVDQGTAVYRLKDVGLTFMVRAIHTANGGSDADVLLIFQNFGNLGYLVSEGNWQPYGEAVFDLSYDRKTGDFYSKKIFTQQPVPMSAFSSLWQ